MRPTEARDVKRIYSLLDQGFQVARISRILQLSVSTVKRIRDQWKEDRPGLGLTKAPPAEAENPTQRRTGGGPASA